MGKQIYMLLAGALAFWLSGLFIGYEFGWVAHGLNAHGKQLNLRRVLWRRITQGGN